MQKLIIHDGAQPETPRFEVTLKHDSGRVRITVAAEGRPWGDKMESSVFGSPIHHASDIAIHKACTYERAPFSAFESVYLADPVPHVSGQYGAPMGRRSRPLEAEGCFRATVVRLNSGGYDKGGAYWGTRPRGVRLYAVQDGMGSLAFIDAANAREAVAKAKG